MVIRRHLCAALLVAAGFSGALAQQSKKPARIGVMSNSTAAVFFEQLKKDFAALGYVEGRDIVFEPRWAEGRLERHPQFASDLVQLGVDLIMAYGGVASAAAQKATRSIPIVFTIVTDPVAIGLAQSMARPGGNATGITSLDPEQATKQLELLREALPNVSRVVILSDDTLPGADASGLVPVERANDAAARALGLQPLVVKVRGPVNDAKLDDAFAAIEAHRAEAILVLEVPVGLAHGRRIAEMAEARKIPSLFPGSLAAAGGLLTYGTSVIDTFPRMSVIADKILKGASPGDLPIETSAKRSLVISVKTARAIGVTLPAELLRRADRVID